jgi:hypothetical protein
MRAQLYKGRRAVVLLNKKGISSISVLQIDSLIQLTSSAGPVLLFVLFVANLEASQFVPWKDDLAGLF